MINICKLAEVDKEEGQPELIHAKRYAIQQTVILSRLETGEAG